MNFALLVNENEVYPVSYTVNNKGEKIKEPAKLKGGDLTENQIKQLYFSGYFDDKPTTKEVNDYIDSL